MAYKWRLPLVLSVPLSLLGMFMQSIAQKVLVRRYSPVRPLSHYGTYYRTLLQSPPDNRSKATQKASHLTSTEITENNSDDMSLYLKVN